MCTGNSCRSQMAEGWCNYLYSDSITAFSAGLEAQGVNPNALEVMKEAGVDIGGQFSSSLDQYLADEFDLIVTVCDHANQHCPIIAGAVRMHHQFDDPPKMASQHTDPTAQIECYRQVRDEIKEWMKGLDSLLGVNLETQSATS